MGFFAKLKKGIGGFFGKVWNGVKTVGKKVWSVVPKVAGVLGGIGAATGQPEITALGGLLGAGHAAGEAIGKAIKTVKGNPTKETAASEASKIKDAVEQVKEHGKILLGGNGSSTPSNILGADGHGIRVPTDDVQPTRRLVLASPTGAFLANPQA